MDPEFENDHPPPATSNCCLVCAQLVLKSEPDDEDEVEGAVVGDPLEVWNYFLEMFGLCQDKDLLLGWDIDKVPLPLCGDCKEQLRPLLEFQREVDRLVEMIEAGRAEIREKSERSERVFWARGVYQADERIHLVRWQMLGREVVENLTSDAGEIGINSSNQNIQEEPAEPNKSCSNAELRHRKRGHSTTVISNTLIKSSTPPESKLLVDETVGKRLTGSFQRQPPPPSPLYDDPSSGWDDNPVRDDSDCKEDSHLINQIDDSTKDTDGPRRNNRRPQRKRRISKRFILASSSDDESKEKQGPTPNESPTRIGRLTASNVKSGKETKKKTKANKPGPKCTKTTSLSGPKRKRVCSKTRARPTPDESNCKLLTEANSTSQSGGGDNPVRDSDCNDDNVNVISQLGDSRREVGRTRRQAAKKARKGIHQVSASSEDESEEEMQGPNPTEKAEDEDYVPPNLASDSDDHASDSDDKEEEKGMVEDEDAPEKIRMQAKKLVFHPKKKYKHLHVTLEHVEGNKFKCSACSELVLSIHQNSLKSHVQRVHTDRTKCPECGTVKPNRRALTKHIRRVHRGAKKIFPLEPCPVCARPVQSEVGIMRGHLWTHYSEEEKREHLAAGDKSIVPFNFLARFLCRVCGHQATKKRLLNAHMDSCHPGQEEKPKEKELCPKCGKSVVELEGHIKRIHDPLDPGVPKQYVCSVCGKVFGSQTSLTIHEKRHDKRFRCGIGNCGRVYASNEDLKRHKKMSHSSSSARRKSVVGLEAHIKGVHDPTDPDVPNEFVCSVCAKVFGNLSSLTRHERRHDKQVRCGICGRGYANDADLKRHNKMKHSSAST